MKTLSIITFLLTTFIGFSQTLPEDFEASIVTSNFVDFDGGVATVLPNPQSSGINTSATVGQIIRNGGQIWAGSKYTLASNLDFSTMTIITMKVYTAAPVGTVVKFKLEGVGATEVDAVTSVSGAWEEITWDFSGTANTYNTIALMFDFGNVGNGSATSTFLFDDIEQSAPILAQIDLPVTFEDPLVDYTVTDFGNNVSTMIVDPTLPTNMVMEVVKPITAPVWAGTTISTTAGFASVIPLTLTETEMTVRVWSPTAGTPIRLKVENASNNQETCETEAVTTVAGAWETLTFNFANEAAGTATLANGISNGWVFNMASIFFNFGTGGATAGSKTYYFDDVQMALPCTTTTSSITETALDVYNAPSGVTYTTSGIYNDTILNAAGCDSIITIDLTMSFTGISEYKLGSIELYPNPSTEKITISVNENFLAYPIMIMDQAGRVVIKSEVVALETEIDITKLKSGIYYVKIGDLKAEKLVKQ